jgi:hypothetical protein
MSAEFNGSDSYLMDTVWGPGSITPAWCFAWVKCTSLSAARGVTWIGNSGRTDQYFAADFSTGGNARTWHRSNNSPSGNNSAVSDNTLTLNKWTPVYFEWAGGSSRRAILDGDFNDLGDDSASTGNFTIIAMSIGAYRDSSPSQYFAGKIGYYLLGSGGVLSDEQIRALCQGLHYDYFEENGLDPLGTLLANEPLVAGVGEVGGTSVSLNSNNNVTFDSTDNPPLVFKLDNHFRVFQSPLRSPFYQPMRAAMFR